MVVQGNKTHTHKKWLQRNIRQDEELIEKYTDWLTTLREEKDAIEQFLDVLSHFTLGSDGRFMVGKQEFKLALIDEALKKIRAYLEHLDWHLQVLVLQAIMAGDGIELLEKLGFTVEFDAPS